MLHKRNGQNKILIHLEMVQLNYSGSKPTNQQASLVELCEEGNYEEWATMGFLMNKLCQLDHIC